MHLDASRNHTGALDHSRVLSHCVVCELSKLARNAHVRGGGGAGDLRVLMQHFSNTFLTGDDMTFSDST